MKLTKNQLSTIVSTICSNELTRLREENNKQRSTPAIKKLVEQAKKEIESLSESTRRIYAWYSCSFLNPSDDTLTDWAMYQLGILRNVELPRWFREQIELKVQMCFIDAKDLKDLEKKVGYKFVIV
jgi:hypothetical protein